MQGLIAIVRRALRQLDGEVARLKRRQAEVERPLEQPTARLRRLEARVGVGQTLQ